jgi:23S rRNA pseudouridine2605 synthase
MAAERLQKYLARAGVASRRHAEDLITEGRVTVNNQKVTELGSKVSPGDLVMVDGNLVTPPEESSYFLLYKPVGVVTTLSDPQGRPTVADYLEKTGKRLFPVGRLDYDAEGALLVTNDGELAHKLTHPSFQVPRTYLAKVKGTPDAATLDKLRGGVRLEDGMATPLSVDVFEQAERNTWLKLVVAEGRPHLIKRLCAAVGSPVVRLYRPSYAGITVEGLRPGELRPLSTHQVRQLQEVADGKATPAEKDLKLPPRRHGRSAPGFEGDGEDDDFVEAAPAPTRSRATGKPARASRTDTRTERPARGAAKTERPARAGRPERKEWAPRGEGGSRPAFRSAAGGRAERRTWTPREEREEGGDRPERREWAPRGGERGERSARPERREWAPRGEGARPERRERKPFASGEGAERRAPARAGRPERREWAPRGEERGERSARPERREWAPRGEGARPERRERRPFASEGSAERRAPARAGGRPERKEWAPRAEGRGERSARPERREWAPRGGGARSESRERTPFTSPSAERRVSVSTGRAERREWAPRGEERGKGRPARRGPAGEGAGEGARPFANWRAKKSQGPSVEWDARPPRGAGGPRGRGPRKGR